MTLVAVMRFITMARLHRRIEQHVRTREALERDIRLAAVAAAETTAEFFGSATNRSGAKRR